MRSRWFHVPELHTAHHDEKSVSWLELFYDLIFVAAIIQLGNALSEDVSWGGFLGFAGHFVPIWVAWTGFTFYANRFEVDDFLHRMLAFIQMFAVGAMAISAPEAMRGHPAKFAMAYALAQGVIVVLNYRSYRQVPEARAYCRYWGGVFAVGAVLWLVSAFVPVPYCYGLWVAGLLAILTAPISKHSRQLMEQFPIDMEHLSERYGLLTIIVLGESFVKVLSFLSSSEHGAEFEYLVKGCLNLTLTCCIWWIYFDDVAGSKLKKARGNWVVWLYCHLPLTLAITGVGVAVKKALKFDFSVVADDKYRWLLAGTLALTLLAVAIIDSVTERRNSELSDRNRVNVRFGSGILMLLLAQVGSTMTAGVFLGLLTAIMVGQVIFDMTMAPMEERELKADTLKSTAEVAQMRKAGVLKRDELRINFGRTIRKGAPAAMRNDLYVWFLDGSWRRLFVSLGVLYLFVNVFFAAVFLLEPGSIGGGASTSFDDAFFFSVQTMSTIGYGVMSPASDFGDIVVTIEAAVGLLGVALATGLIFSKASRPKSAALFSAPLIVTARYGKPALMLRVGNARGNEVADAAISITVMKDEFTPEGQHMRRLHDIKLVRDKQPMFVMSWLVMHEIDEDSPLYDIDWSKPDEHILMFIVTLLGHDSTYGQTSYARHVYYPDDIHVGARFVDVIQRLPDGRSLIDYHKFHLTEPDPEALALLQRPVEAPLGSADTASSDTEQGTATHAEDADNSEDADDSTDAG